MTSAYVTQMFYMFLRKYYFFSFFIYIIVLRCIRRSQLKSIALVLGPRLIIHNKQLLFYNTLRITSFPSLHLNCIFLNVLFYYFLYNIIMQMHLLEWWINKLDFLNATKTITVETAGMPKLLTTIQCFHKISLWLGVNHLT